MRLIDADAIHEFVENKVRRYSLADMFARDV